MRIPWILDQFLWKKEAEADVIGVDASQGPNSPILGLLSFKLGNGAQHDDLARRDISRNTPIKEKHVVHAPRHQLEVLTLNVDRGGIPGGEAHNYAILSG